MQFLIADTFTSALAKLGGQEQKAVKITVYDLQQDPADPGLQLHRVDNSKDANFWSVRVNRDIRLVVHKTGESMLVCYVDHHDDAYKWAERRKIETHPRTGAAQIVEIRERVEEIQIPRYVEAEPSAPGVSERLVRPALFDALGEEELLSVGVPEDWVTDVQNANEDQFLELADHIPPEASEALLEYIDTGQLQIPVPAQPDVNPFEHPDAQRRFRVMDNVQELQQALDYPWDKWAIFLHPSQRELVERRFNGPARVAGSAGTGKTVVALHRAAHIFRSDSVAKVLLTTFSTPLANSLRYKLELLLARSAEVKNRVTVLPFEGIARDLFRLIRGHDPRLARGEHIEAAISQATENVGLSGVTQRFLLSEWRNVIDAWQIMSVEDYKRVRRLGRKNRLGSKQRERMWPVFERTREILHRKEIYTPASMFDVVTEHYRQRDEKPFSHIIVDEAQDLGVPELRMLGAIAPKKPDSVFFAGDLGQRIFQEPFSWKSLGIDVRGRSYTLKVNYRTSHQIREAVDRLLPEVVRDVDGIEEDRRGTVSVFNGPEPQIVLFDDATAESAALAEKTKEIVASGVPQEEVGIFVRSEAELGRARSVVKGAGEVPLELSHRVQDRTGRIAIGTMHLAKGLEFKVVFVMSCDEEVLPDQDRVDTVADEAELDLVYETERQLFYVACTRAREQLFVSGVDPGSEFLGDLTDEQH